ncbi:hypothetical protein MYX77_09900 [Acidobacteriia bacterium AH_259_A11_L15]|nr:hypothetical protein [Acidobacteriia bacterium AH_259_A11_L15]
MTPQQLAFFRSYIRRWANTLYEHGSIDWTTCGGLQSFCQGPDAKPTARELFSRKEATSTDGKLRFRLRPLREITGGTFNLIEVAFSGARPWPARTCFVGHRFIPSLKNTLRWNLRHVLDAFNIDPKWSGHDLSARQIFEDIVRRIGGADFCVFDNRATLGRPNVYIEAAIAHALKKPFLFFHFTPTAKRSKPVIPTDLAHTIRLPYKSYRQLFAELYFRLPSFIDENLK